jgi:hypothetical protein
MLHTVIVYSIAKVKQASWDELIGFGTNGNWGSTYDKVTYDGVTYEGIRSCLSYDFFKLCFQFVSLGNMKNLNRLPRLVCPSPHITYTPKVEPTTNLNQCQTQTLPP